MAQTKKVAPKLSEEQTKKLNSFTTMSDRIRYLDKQNFERADIGRILLIRYQWVKNVLDADKLRRS